LSNKQGVLFFILLINQNNIYFDFIDFFDEVLKKKNTLQKLTWTKNVVLLDFAHLLENLTHCDIIRLEL